MACQLVCTGWYAADVVRSYQTGGDDVIRSANFRPLWWRSLKDFVDPGVVLLVDSASPLKPNDRQLVSCRYEVIELLHNPGHSQNLTGHYSGYMASVLLGLEYALHSGVDYMLYVEQDVLLYGSSLIGKIERELLKSDYVFGHAVNMGTIQQSLFAISAKGIRRFLSRVHSIPLTDKELGPESKFSYAATPHLPGFTLRPCSRNTPEILRRPYAKLWNAFVHIFGGYRSLPFGYGRHRPINFRDEVFYFQHGDRREISQYESLCGTNIISGS